MNKLTIRIETTSPGKSILPWVALSRRGRQSVDTQLFALIGYPERELTKLTPQDRETARDTLEIAIRLLTSFEYIPIHEQAAD